MRSADVRDGYVEHALAVGEPRPRCGSRSTAATAWRRWGSSRCCRALPLEVERLYFEPDGTFPNHEADPLKRENLDDLSPPCSAAAPTSASPSTATATAPIFVDEHGEPIPADLMTGLLARSQLRRHGGSGRVLYDLRSSRATAEEIAEAGGIAEMCRVGHSFVKAQMRESGAIFAGELSGHFYFRFSDTLVADDGIAALRRAARRARRETASRSRSWSRRCGATPRAARSTGASRDTPALLAALEAEHAGKRPRSRTSTGCWSATPTGGSTCGRRTPSRCCG